MSKLSSLRVLTVVVLTELSYKLPTKPCNKIECDAPLSQQYRCHLNPCPSSRTNTTALHAWRLACYFRHLNTLLLCNPPHVKRIPSIEPVPKSSSEHPSCKNTMSSTNQKEDTSKQDQILLDEEQALQSSSSGNNESGPGENNEKKHNANAMEWDGPDDPVRLCSPRTIFYIGVLTFNCISVTQGTSLRRKKRTLPATWQC